MFDPYLEWLGIPRAEQPADHYRLLGLQRFESDVAKIREAGEQRIRHVRTFQLGEHGPLTQDVLNDLARAKACLCNPEIRAKYDQELREAIQRASNQPSATIPPAEQSEPAPVAVTAPTPTCPTCSVPLAIPPALYDKPVQCPKCKTHLRVDANGACEPIQTANVQAASPATAPTTDDDLFAELDQELEAVTQPRQWTGSATAPRKPRQRRKLGKKSPTSNLHGYRSVALGGLLGIMVLALAYDFGIARRRVTSAHETVTGMLAEVENAGNQVLTPAMVQASIGSLPSKTFADGGREVQLFEWRSGLPFRSHKLFVTFGNVNGSKTMLGASMFGFQPGLGLGLAEANNPSGPANDDDDALQADVSLASVESGTTNPPATAEPAIAEVADQTVEIGESLFVQLQMQNVGSVVGFPSYRFVGEPPSGMTLDVLTGKIRWTPRADQGPGTYPVTVGINSAGVSADNTRSFTVRVTDSPTEGPPPELAVAPFDARQAQSHQEAWAKHLRTPVTIRNSVGMELNLIPVGTFMMGSPASEKDRGDDEQQHHVTLSNAFYMGVYEVTQAQYEQVMRQNPSKFNGAKIPVERVSWDDAVAFCRKLSELPEEQAAGREYRLPTEAEWEYACRAGTTTAYSFGNDEDQLGDYAWYKDNSAGTTHPVGQERANPCGFFDMHGNVWEWCQDWYGDYPSGSVTDPTGPAGGSFRVCRGGSWRRTSGYCRSAYRNGSTPGYRLNFLGFRLVSICR